MSAAVPDLAALQAALDNCPFHKLFDLRVTAADAVSSTLELTLRYTPAVERAPDTRQYHGGVIASLIDIAGDYALMLVLGHVVPTINFRVDYLRPAVDTDLRARALVRRVGRTVGVVDIDVIDDRDRLVAVGRGCYSASAG